MPIKTIGRDKIRKKPLEHRCYSAEAFRPFEDDEDEKLRMYVFCRGYNYKLCGDCPAYKPREVWELPPEYWDM